MGTISFSVTFTLGLAILVLTTRRVYIELDKLDTQIDDLLIVFLASIGVLTLSLVDILISISG